ncbi:hypothetical protein HF288_06385 [Acidithiobacillus caldus]|jgi:hypothetical protein|uniref:hypothetical protein n=1 Tax=Acidithiobacillus caldus TaxID=33059 RepID=UPI001C07376F|nr:hypothetical protein [Acidithiobacillus caldus]MBU2790523.1 hypothetical protein [Acidithiobacillus caldus]MBU2820946.1 hypothetical protein [Acidithiobacillus caldus]
MRRVSNLAFNREFPAVSGLSGIPKDNRVKLARDLHNAFDADAVGVWLEGFPSAPLGWLYRKDSNRDAVLRKLDEGGTLIGHVEVQKRSGKPIKVVVFWL